MVRPLFTMVSDRDPRYRSTVDAYDGKEMPPFFTE
jgi:hypothetical protein